MCGDYDSVIGMEKSEPLQRFLRKLPVERMRPAEGEATVCGVAVETDDATGLARMIAPIRIGGRLSQAWCPPGNPPRRHDRHDSIPATREKL